MKTVSQILQEGRARIAAPGGWTQYQMSSRPRPDGRRAYCAVGAIYNSGRWLSEDYRAVTAALAALERAVPGGGGVGDYNDDARTTQADILALYDQALTEVTK